MSVGRTMLANQLYNDLKTEVDQGRLQAGSPVMSTKQLSNKYNISVLTVNKAIGRLVDEGLLYRIHGSGTFVADRVPVKNYKTGLSFIIPEGDFRTVEVAFSSFRTPAAEFLKKHNCDVRFLTKAEINSGVLSELDGLIASTWMLDRDFLPVLEKFKGPVVLMQQEKILDNAFHQVVPDIKNGYVKAIRHLMELGHKKLALAGFGKGNRERVKIFYSATEEAGFPGEGIYEYFVDKEVADFGRITGQKIGKAIFNDDKVAGIFSISDFISFGIIDAALERGKAPGKDFALVSYDNLEGDGLCPFGEPLISSVTYPKREISETAARLLLSLIENKDSNCHIVRVATELVIRKSSSGDK